MSERKTLHIDMNEVLFAMDSTEHDMLSFFLDVETGEVCLLCEDNFEGDEDDFAKELERPPGGEKLPQDRE
jgi:hypothetical protein